jgi:hypothetical protein
MICAVVKTEGQHPQVLPGVNTKVSVSLRKLRKGDCNTEDTLDLTKRFSTFSDTRDVGEFGAVGLRLSDLDASESQIG